MITEDLKVNANPLIFEGFDESIDGEFTNFRPFKANPVTNSYDILSV